MMWFFQASFSDCLNPRICRLFLYILPIPSIFTNIRHIHHTGSSSHLGILYLCTSISDCHTRSFAHLGVACLCTSIQINHPDFLSLPVAFLLHTHLPTAPPPIFSFPRFIQGGPKLFSRRLLAPPRIPPHHPSFIPSLPCTYLILLFVT